MKRICLVVMTVLSVLLVSCISYSQTSIWYDDVVDLDMQKSDQRKVRTNEGKIESWNCYKVNRSDFEKLWNSSSFALMYRGTGWCCLESENEYKYIEGGFTS